MKCHILWLFILFFAVFKSNSLSDSSLQRVKSKTFANVRLLKHFALFEQNALNRIL